MIRPRKEAPVIPGLTLMQRLGSGGYADVYLYEQERPKRRVAVKVLSDMGLSNEILERFTAEANAMAQLADHPFIVQVFQADTAADGRPYLVMKYYPQPNLGVRAKAERIPVAEVLAIGIRIASAVETAHRAGILHRDIKPANILTSQYGEPGLADFGIASTKENQPGESEGMSIPWASPEVVFGTSEADERSDVYSLGATLWHLLVGRSPFEILGGDNSSLSMTRRVRESPPPRTGRADVPPDLERLIAQSLAKVPALRPSSALELAKSLQAIEVAQRWNPTPLVILDDSGTGVVDAGGNDSDDDSKDDRTRLRGAARISAQGAGNVATRKSDEQPDLTRRRQHVSAGSAAAVPSLEVAGNGPRPRVGIPTEPASDGTIRRPMQLRSDLESTPSSTLPRKGTRKVIAFGVVLVVAAIAVGVVILESSNGGNVNSTTTTVQAVSNGNAIDSQIGVPIVKLTPSASGSVIVSWTYSNVKTGDRFRVQVNGGQWIDTSTPSFTVNTTSGQSICAVVQVERADGSATSPISPPVCVG